DIPVLRTTKLYIDMLEELNIKGKVKLIVNRETNNKGIEQKNIEEILGVSVYKSLPEQERIVKNSLNEGVPFVLAQPRTPISKAIIQLAEKLTETEADVLLPRKKEKRGFLISK
ncbi:MAG: response regulator receiver protein, partial [Neobacillus sp.]|nr:response regulator receiver protein [Neobacillus sp.]